MQFHQRIENDLAREAASRVSPLDYATYAPQPAGIEAMLQRLHSCQSQAAQAASDIGAANRGLTRDISGRLHVLTRHYYTPAEARRACRRRAFKAMNATRRLVRLAEVALAAAIAAAPADIRLAA